MADNTQGHVLVAVEKIADNDKMEDNVRIYPKCEQMYVNMHCIYTDQCNYIHIYIKYMYLYYL